MSAPRPLPWRLVVAHVRAADGVETVAVDSPVTAYAERAVNAFDALLAVAKAVPERIEGGNGSSYCVTCPTADSEPHEANCPLARLSAQHPDWREWSA